MLLRLLPLAAHPELVSCHADELTFADEERIMSLHERLHAEGKRSMLIVLQGMDTSGKEVQALKKQIIKAAA